MTNLRNAFLAIAALLSLVANAQDRVGQLSLIPRVGFSITQLTNDEIMLGTTDEKGSVGKRWKPGVEAGIDLEYFPLSRLSLTAGVKYSLQGSKFKDFHLAGNESDGVVRFAAFSRLTSDLHYLQCPVMLHFYLTRAVSIGAGIQFGHLLSAKENFSYTVGDAEKQTGKVLKYYSYDRSTGNLAEVEEGGDRFFEYHETVTGSYKRGDISIPLSLSYESDDVILDLRYDLGLNNISKEIGKMRNSVVTLSIGYRIPLTQ